MQSERVMIAAAFAHREVVGGQPRWKSPAMSKRGFREMLGGGPVDLTGQPPTRFDYVEKCLDVAMVMGNNSMGPQLPWESNAFVAEVLNPDMMPWLRPLAVPRSLSATPQQSLNSGKEEPIRAKVTKIRTAAYSALHKSSDVERAGVILKLAELLMMFPEDTTVGQMLLQCVNDEKKILTTLHDVFAKKATSTLTTRSGSLAMFLAWHVATYPEEKIGCQRLRKIS